MNFRLAWVLPGYYSTLHKDAITLLCHRSITHHHCAFTNTAGDYISKLCAMVPHSLDSPGVPLLGILALVIAMRVTKFRANKAIIGFVACSWFPDFRREFV